MNLGTVVKMLGIKVPPETVAQIEAIIPQLPARANQVIQVVNSSLQNFDERLRALEAGQREILEVLHGRTDNDKPAGVGHTQLALERGSLNGSGGGSE